MNNQNPKIYLLCYRDDVFDGQYEHEDHKHKDEFVYFGYDRLGILEPVDFHYAAIFTSKDDVLKEFKNSKKFQNNSRFSRYFKHTHLFEDHLKTDKGCGKMFIEQYRLPQR